MEYILYEAKGNIATITINREKALNALNSQVLDELNATLDAVDLNTVRCLNNATHVYLVNLLRLNTCSVQRFLDNDCTQLRCGGSAQ